jgi:anti-sigma regulatory factor (Ser/Thr protein kinase)
VPRTPGFHLRSHSHGFVVHIIASPRNLRTVHELTANTLCDLRVAVEAIGTAQLIVSELIGNCVRAYDDHVPLVIEVYVPSFGVAVNVHDPGPSAPAAPPRRGLDDPDAESGRGLPLLDLLAPGWHIQRSPIGKQVRCRVAHPAG